MTPTDTFLCGLDEAGRGPLLGPMFLAVVRFPKLSDLSALPLKESKAFGSSPKGVLARRELARAIMGRASFAIAEIPPATIDRFVLQGPGLNVLEQVAAARLIRNVCRGLPVMADGANLFNPLRHEFPMLIARNKADNDYPAVAAASILAKNARDSWFEDFAARMMAAHGIHVSGGGYVNKKTDLFLEEYVRRTGARPKELRCSWKRKPKPLQLF